MWGFLSGSVLENPPCQRRRHRFDPLSRNIPHASQQLSPCATTIEPVLWSPGTTTTEPSSHNHWSPQTREPKLSNKRSHHNEKRTYNWRVDPSCCKERTACTETEIQYSKNINYWSLTCDQRLILESNIFLKRSLWVELCNLALPGSHRTSEPNDGNTRVNDK